MSDLFEAKVLIEKIERFREEKQLTIVELAHAVGKDKSHLHKIIHLVNRPSFNMLIDLARYMGVPPYSLLIPSEALLRQHLVERVHEKLAELKWTEDELSVKTGIHPLRLAEVLKGINLPNYEEKESLAVVLGLDEFGYSTEDKFNLLSSLLKDLGLQDEQVTLFVDYVKKSVK